MRRFLAKALATLLVAFSASALAMGLGDIRLNSYLNQRLDAEIELVSAAADETDTLVVSLADYEAFERVGLERSAVLNTLEFEVVKRPNGTAFIKVTSSEPIREPFLTFLIEADWSRGRLLREYTLLLDPPTFAQRRSAEPAEAQPPVSETPAMVEREPAEEPMMATEPEPMPEPEMPGEPVAMPAESPSADEAADAGMADAPVEVAEEDVSIPPLEADADEMAADSGPARYTPAPPAASVGSYGPVARNETLWAIASRLKPDDSITMNQMMVAIYRANPEAFNGNINRLKQGYILRIPEFVEVTAISTGEAFNAARQMNDEWNASRGVTPAYEEDFTTEEDFVAEEPASEPEPEPQVEMEPEPAPEPEVDDSLSLVAPSEEVEPEVGTGVGAGGEADDIGAPGDLELESDADDVDSGAVDIVEGEGETGDRLVDIEDESMQAVQEGAADDMVEPEEPIELPPLPSDTATGEEPVAEEPAAVDSEPEAAADETQDDSSTVVRTRERDKDLLEQAIDFAMSTIGMAVIGLALVLVLVVSLLMVKRRREAREQTASEIADWMADEEVGDDDETTLAGGDDDDVTVVAGADGGAEEDTIFGRPEEMEGSGTEALDQDADATQMLDADSTQAASPSMDDTMVGGETVTLDENDPLSEADFNMAYGLYDQAADVVSKAIERSPDNAELHAKLCEIHFAANNTDEFIAAATRLKELSGGDGSDWNNVAIMGQQIAPNEALFAGGGGGGDVDLDFSESEADGAAEAPAQDFGETMIGSAVDDADSGTGGGDDLDFDIDAGDLGGSADTAESSAPAEESAGGDEADLDFDLDFGSDQPAAAEADSDDDLSGGDAGDLDLGDFGMGDDSAGEAEEPAAGAGSFDEDSTQTEFDKALNELSAYVDTNLPEGGAGDAVEDEGGGEDLNLDEFSFDKESESLAGGDDSSDDDDEEEGLGEIGTKLDLARAYVDMGDPEGAKSILEEVVEDGDEQQKKEAQELLDKL